MSTDKSAVLVRRWMLIIGTTLIAGIAGCGDGASPDKDGEPVDSSTGAVKPTIESVEALVALTPTSEPDHECSAPTSSAATTETAGIGVRRIAGVDCTGTIEGFGVAQFNDGSSAASGAEKLLAMLNNYVRTGPYDSDGPLGSDGRCVDSYQDTSDDTPADDSQNCVLVRDRYVLFGIGEQDEQDSGEVAAHLAALWFESAAR